MEFINDPISHIQDDILEEESFDFKHVDLFGHQLFDLSLVSSAAHHLVFELEDEDLVFVAQEDVHHWAKSLLHLQ
jgi:hypothetical protein